MRSYGSASVTAAYTGPLPGTLCYDGSCRQAAPGYYTAPGESVIRTWTENRTEDCPAGYTGSVTITERWRTVKYWTPSAGGLSSRGRCASQALPEMKWRAGRRRTTARLLRLPHLLQTHHLPHLLQTHRLLRTRCLLLLHHLHHHHHLRTRSLLLLRLPLAAAMIARVAATAIADPRYAVTRLRNGEEGKGANS